MKSGIKHVIPEGGSWWYGLRKEDGALLRLEKRRSTTQGSSTVDIFIYRGCNLGNVQIAEGPWDGCSDHTAVYATFKAARYDASRDHGHISKAQRLRPDLKTIAEYIYPYLLKNALNRFRSVTSKQEIDASYNQSAEEMIKPFVPRGKGPKKRTARVFWSSHWQKLSQERSVLYRIQLRTKSQKDVLMYRMKEREVKRESRKARRRTWNTFKRELGEANCSTAASKLAAIL